MNDGASGDRSRHLVHGGRAAAWQTGLTTRRREPYLGHRPYRGDPLRLPATRRLPLYTEPGESAEALEKELEAAREAGLRDVEIVERVPIESFETGAALRFPRQGR